MSKLVTPHGAGSLTRLREMFANGEPIPPEFSRPEVVDVLREYYDGPNRR